MHTCMVARVHLVSVGLAQTRSNNTEERIVKVEHTQDFVGTSTFPLQSSTVDYATGL